MTKKLRGLERPKPEPKPETPDPPLPRKLPAIGGLANAPKLGALKLGGLRRKGGNAK